MNIFEKAPEFIEYDNRQDREINRVTAESTFNRLSVQLPDWYVKDKTILDLGSCLGAAGHMALTNGAKHYTGVEVQEKYVNDSNTIFQKYWPTNQYNIVKANLEEFLDDCIKNKVYFDIVIASGVLYTFLDIVKILEKISAVSNNSVLIDTIFVKDPPGDKGLIIVREDISMVYANGPNTYAGIGSICSLKALDIIFKTTGFYRTEEPIIPPVTLGSHDGYNDLLDQGIGIKVPARYAARFTKKNIAVKKLIDIVLDNDTNNIQNFFQEPNIVESATNKVWKFDDSVANRFQQEANDNIPDYARVIDLCLQFAADNISKDDSIIDVGSALGYTVDKFVNAGFKNIKGLDNSESMVSKSMHKDKIILGDKFPDQSFKLILINWTLHFILDKASYIKDMYQNLEEDGYLIISDKTNLTPETKKMYYDFKRANGISEEYIVEKEKKLAGYMHTVPASWYPAMLTDIGFKSVEIINARLGFVTYLCKK